MTVLDHSAAEFVLGTLPADQMKKFADDLRHDAAAQARVGFWQTEFQELAEAIPAVEPSPASLATIEATLDGLPPPGATTIRGDEGEWVEVHDGVYKKSLYIDHRTDTESYLLRLDAGAALPAHSHSQAEECLVLEGELTVGLAVFSAGDYQVIPASIPHLPTTTETGALMFIRRELHP